VDDNDLDVAREQLIRDGISREESISAGIAAFNAARELVPEPVFVPSEPATFSTSTKLK
jgi:hypothetical protein